MSQELNDLASCGLEKFPRLIPQSKMTFNAAVSHSYTCVVCKALWDAKRSVIFRNFLDY